LQTWEERAVKANYEILSKREKISAAKKALAGAKFDRYPTVDLNIQLSRGSSESTFFVNSETKSQSVGLTFFLPIYQGGSISSKIRQSTSLLDAEIEGLRFQEEDLRKRVQKTYFGMQDNIKLSEALNSAVKSATVELDANRKSAIAGVRKQLDILVSQQNLLRVERELVDSNLNIILFWLNLNMLTSSIDRSTIEKTNKFFN
jgi:outer membrane protein